MNVETPYSRRSRNSKMFAGMLLLGIGGVLLLKELNLFFFPWWLFSWPMLLIVLGLYIGAKHNFQRPTWFILVLVGVAFLLDEIFNMYELRHLVWPLIIIALGVWMIFKRNQHKPGVTWDARMQPSQPDVFDNTTGEPLAAEYTKDSSNSIPPSGDDFFDSTSVFSGSKKTILSKNFKGGDVVNIFGGTEIDLTQADINGRVVIDVTQLFGAVKLIIPSHWRVSSEVAAIFSGINDKRKVFGAMQQATDKILVLKGTSIMAGIDIHSY